MSMVKLGTLYVNAEDVTLIYNEDSGRKDYPYRLRIQLKDGTRTTADYNTEAASPYFQEGIGVTEGGELVCGTVAARRWRLFVSAYPVLVKQGKAVEIVEAQEINYNARRTMVGYNDTTVYIVLVETPGLAFKAMQAVMTGLGCRYAVNLDGGGSTKGLVNGTVITKDAGNRKVDNVLAVYLKRTIYRVQLGAFTNWEKAAALRDKVRKLEDPLKAGYKDAFAKWIGGYWKVQVGAFTKEKNAERVKADLVDRGFQAFVTIGTEE